MHGKMHVLVGISIELIDDVMMDGLEKKWLDELAQGRDSVHVTEKGMIELRDLMKISQGKKLSDESTFKWLWDEIMETTEGNYPKSIWIAKIRNSTTKKG